MQENLCEETLGSLRRQGWFCGRIWQRFNVQRSPQGMASGAYLRQTRLLVRRKQAGHPTNTSLWTRKVSAQTKLPPRCVRWYLKSADSQNSAPYRAHFLRSGSSIVYWRVYGAMRISAAPRIRRLFFSCTNNTALRFSRFHAFCNGTFVSPVKEVSPSPFALPIRRMPRTTAA